MKLFNAKAIAERIKENLKPYCNKIEIAGSIRREKSDVKDIEIVCIPRTILKETIIADLFGSKKVTEEIRHPEFINYLLKQKIRKGKPLTGKYIKFSTDENIEIDCFIADYKNWGWIYALRTGSADFSHGLAKKINSLGYTMQKGYIYKTTKLIELQDEKAIFDLINLPFIAPKDRI